MFYVVVLYNILFFLLNLYYAPLTEISKTAKTLYFLSYTFLEYFIFAFILYYNISNKIFKKLILALSALFIVFIISFYLSSSIKLIDSIPIGIESILIFIFIFYYFFQSLRNNTTFVYQNTSFWLIVGILIYLGGTFFFNILGNNINNEDVNKYWYFSYIGDILKNIFFSIAILFLARNPKDKSFSKAESVPYLDMI